MYNDDFQISKDIKGLHTNVFFQIKKGVAESADQAGIKLFLGTK